MNQIITRIRSVSLALVVAIVLTACAGTPFSWEDTAKVQNGMTEQEVIAILGKPYMRSQSGNTTILTWSFATAFGGAKAVSYTLIDGRVTGVTSINQ